LRSSPAAALPPRLVATAAPSSAPTLAEIPSGRCVLRTTDRPPPAVALGPAPGCPADPEPRLPALPTQTLSFRELSGLSVNAEVVRSEHDTMRGLMYRHNLPEDRGMLFDLLSRTNHKFWMHNTCIPLDLLFIDVDGLIVGIVENAPTLNDETRDVGCPSRWVLEVNAGWSRRHGVFAGQHVVFPE